MGRGMLRRGQGQGQGEATNQGGCLLGDALDRRRGGRAELGRASTLGPGVLVASP